MKRCSKCGFECDIEVAGEYFYKRKDRKSGYRSYCNLCEKRYQKANPEERKARKALKLTAEQKIEYRKAKAKQYREANREKEKLRKHRYRALKSKNGGSYTVDDIAILYEQQLATCAYCHCDISDGYEIDHIQPISKGGSNSPYNLALACFNCNRSKSNKTLFEFLNTMTDITIPEAQSYVART